MKKKDQHPAAFEPSTSWSRGAALQPRRLEVLGRTPTEVFCAPWFKLLFAGQGQDHQPQQHLLEAVLDAVPQLRKSRARFRLRLRLGFGRKQRQLDRGDDGADGGGGGRQQLVAREPLRLEVQVVAFQLGKIRFDFFSKVEIKSNLIRASNSISIFIRPNPISE